MARRLPVMSCPLELNNQRACALDYRTAEVAVNGITKVISIWTLGVFIGACGHEGINTTVVSAPTTPTTPTPPAPAPVTSVTISGVPENPTGSFQLTASAALADGTRKDVTGSAAWGTSDSRVATVASTGRVTVLQSGEVDVRAVYEGVTGSVHLVVSVPGTFTLNGIVRENGMDGVPVDGARVQIVIGPFVYTDGGGLFTLHGAPSGRAILEVTKDGYQVWSNEIVVDHDMEVTGVFLHPVCPGPRCTSVTVK